MFDLVYELGWWRYAGLNRVLNRWNILPPPEQDDLLLFAVHFQFPLEVVLQSNILTDIFENTSQAFINYDKARNLGIPSPGESLFKSLISNKFFGGTLTRQGDQVTVTVSSDLNTLQSLRALCS